MKVARQQYRKVKLNAVKPHPRNPRKGSLEAIGESLEANDFYGAIVVQKGTGYVLAGNHRLLAAKQAGAKELPAMVVDCDDETALRILLADNATSDKAEYDTPELHALLKEIGQEAGTLEGTGWGFDDFRALEREVAKLTNGDAGADEVPEPPAEPRSKPGEIYELGPHRLMCGDATDAEQVEALMAGERADLLATDPPYCVDYQGGAHPASESNEGKANKDKDWSAVYREVEIKDAEAFFTSFLRAARGFALSDSAAWYVWFAIERYPELRRSWETVDALAHQVIVWKKSRPVLTYSHFMQAVEYCQYGWVRGQQPTVDRRPPPNAQTIWEVGQVGQSDGIHPTQKPVALFSDPVVWHLAESEIVYEPFGGSGTTLIAAETFARRCFAMELEPAFCDVIRDRYEGFAAARSVAA